MIDHETALPTWDIVSGGPNGGGDLYYIISETRDAVGEAFDKVARHLGLRYRVALRLKTAINNLTAASSNNKRTGYEFSFSGLKTAVVKQ